MAWTAPGDAPPFACSAQPDRMPVPKRPIPVVLVLSALLAGAARAPAAAPVPPAAKPPAVGPFTAAAAAVGPAPGRPLFGYNDQSVNYRVAPAAVDAALSARAGASVVRITLDWRYAEPQPGDYRFAAWDVLYRQMLARGIRPIWVVLFSPPWAWDPSVRCDLATADCGFPPGRAHLAEWREFVAAVTVRYPASAGIEVWNEPNLVGFWGSPPDPARYTDLLRNAYAAVKAADPAMPVIGGGVTNLPYSTSKGMALREYLTGMYANGAAGAMDALGVHAYTLLHPYEDWIGKTLADTRAVRARFGDSGRPIWVTETGVTTTDPDPQYRVDEARQAAELAGIYLRLAAARDVGAVVVHTLVDVATRTQGREVGFGVLRADLSAKPAFCALAQAASGLPCR
jgi:hypothetical protein